MVYFDISAKKKNVRLHNCTGISRVENLAAIFGRQRPIGGKKTRKRRYSVEK